MYQPRMCKPRRNRLDTRLSFHPVLTCARSIHGDEGADTRDGLGRARLRGSRRGATPRRVQVRQIPLSVPSRASSRARRRRPRRVRVARVDVSHEDLAAHLLPAPFASPHGRRGRAPSRASVRARAAPTASISTSPLSDIPADAPSDPFAALQGALVHHAPTGDLVDLGARLDASPGKTTVVAFMRSFG